ncbi:MAG: hypothetical protein KF683_02060, partial [Rubrivivax sp.]|nr:hypothetical protein [Rubrivivax sp.]
DYDVALAVAAWGELAAGRGQLRLAAGLWRLALGMDVLEAAPRDELHDRLQALPEPDRAASALGLEQALALIAHAPDAGKR